MGPEMPITNGQLIAPEERRDTIDPEAAEIIDRAFYRSVEQCAEQIIALNPLMEDQVLEQAEGWVEVRVAATDTPGSQP